LNKIYNFANIFQRLQNFFVNEDSNMTEGPKLLRLSKIAKEFNIGTQTIVDFLAKKGIAVDQNPNTKISEEAFDMLAKEFQKEKNFKEEVRKTSLSFTKRESISLPDEKGAQKAAAKEMDESEPEEHELFIKDIKSSFKQETETTLPESDSAKDKVKLAGPKIIGKLDPNQLKAKPAPAPAPVPAPAPDPEPAPVPKVEPIQEKHTEPVAEEPVKHKEPEPEVISAKPEVEEKPKEEEPVEREEAPVAVKPEESHSTHEKEVSADVDDTTEESVGETTAPIPSDQDKPDNFYKTQVKKLEGVTILGRMELPAPKDKTKKPVASSSDVNEKSKKRKRKRIRKEKVEGEKPASTGQTTQGGEEQKRTPGQTNDQQRDQRKPKPQQNQPNQPNQQQQQQGKHKKVVRKDFVKPEVSDEEISRQIRETLATLSGNKKSKAAKHRKQKRDIQQKQRIHDLEQAASEEKILRVTEFVSANELSSLMNVSVVEVISVCMNLGLVVSINQRLDAESITIVADEFGFEVEFISVDAQESIKEVEDTPDQLKSRAPIVTVMGHVDHGKTSLLDHIRHANVIAGEAGGITQHIGAYSVQLEDGKMISFLDTPGHEAFTAMRARGAKVTDVAIIVVAADDNVMPQTVEAINHAQAAGVPLVIAINKIDKPSANPEKVKEELAKINILVEDWGGKYQSQEISAKNGINIDKLLEKVLLEAELLDLKANPDRNASGTVIESSLDKGRGYLATILVQNGTLRVGDIVVAGNHHGRVKAMFNERNVRIHESGPATPALILGLDGAPTAGDTFHVVNDEQEAKSITSKRQQLIREQGLRTQKHITLDEIGRRIAIGDFKELNIIIKADVDGSVEALADSLLKLGTAEVQVNIIHKAVGPITEGDVLLASASNAIIVGFNVRPSLAARKLAENEEIDIRIYSIIYNAINEIKSAIEGMLSPEIEEKIIANIEVRDTFKITKVGTVAGCMVLDGKITRNSRIRVIRDGIVVYTGYLGSLKRYKDDVKEVSSGYECGLNIDRFNDIKVGDIIEAYEIIEIARKLD
jgi:translation initiation factor IF-2